MKKLIFAAAIVAAVGFTACGNKTNSAAGDAADSTAAVDSAAEGAPQQAADSLISVLGSNISSKDSKSLQATMESIKAKYDELVKAGKIEEAKAYAAQFKEYLDAHADELKAIAGGNSTVNTLINTVTSLPTTAEETVSTAKETVDKVANSGKEVVKEEVENKKQEAKDKANEAVNKAADKAANSVKGAIGKAFGN